MTKKTLLLLFLFSSINTLQLGQTNEDYDNLLYLITYLFFWFFLIDISLIIIIHYKNSSYYLANHSFINFCILIGMFINNFVFLRKLKSWENYELLPLEIIIFVLEIL